MRYLFVGLTLLLGSQTWAANDKSLDKVLRGKPFSDPAELMQMSPEWQAKPISYRDWGKDAVITVHADQQFYPLILPIVERYAKQNNIIIKSKEGTCGTAAKDLTEKAIDVGGFCCPPAKSDRLEGLKYHTLGIESIIIMLNTANPTNNLTYTQLQQIYQGKITRWSEINPAPFKAGTAVGAGKDLIDLIGRLHCKQRPGHWRLLIDNEEQYGARLNNVSTISDMITQVTTKPYAIGFEELLHLERLDKQRKAKAIMINNISPTDVERLAKGDYPIYNTFSLTTWENQATRNPHAAKLVQYVIDNMDEIAAKYGIASAKKLRENGWIFNDNELVGEPPKK
jgi:phosphate transport system substrate-binding protein